MTSTYVTHARTLAELRAEFVSDLDRRIDMLQSQRNVITTSAITKARLACAIIELTDARRYWSAIILVSAKKRSTASK